MTIGIWHSQLQVLAARPLSRRQLINPAECASILRRRQGPRGSSVARYSMMTFSSFAKTVLFQLRRKRLIVINHWPCGAGCGPKNPTRGTFSAAAREQKRPHSAAPPTRCNESRRLIFAPEARTRDGSNGSRCSEGVYPCPSALGQKQTFAVQEPMSAFGLERTTEPQLLMSSRPFTAMSVAVRKAISFSRSPVLANTSALEPEWRVCSGFTHTPTSQKPLARRRGEKIDLKLCGENAGVGSIRLSAAYPAALSAMALTAPPAN